MIENKNKIHYSTRIIEVISVCNFGIYLLSYEFMNANS